MYLQHQTDDRHGLKPPAWIDGSDQLQLRSSVTYAQWLMNKNSKHAALKALQRKIWQKKGILLENCKGRFIRIFLNYLSDGEGRNERSVSIPPVVF